MRQRKKYVVYWDNLWNSRYYYCSNIYKILSYKNTLLIIIIYKCVKFNINTNFMVERLVDCQICDNTLGITWDTL